MLFLSSIPNCAILSFLELRARKEELLDVQNRSGFDGFTFSSSGLDLECKGLQNTSRRLGIPRYAFPSQSIR